MTVRKKPAIVLAKPGTTAAIAVRDFNDAGTNERFATDQVLELEPGRFANFALAGLVRAPSAPTQPA